MAIRNAQAIQNRSNQIKTEKQTAEQIRQQRIDSAKAMIRGQYNNIIDAVDTYYALARVMPHDKHEELSAYKAYSIYVSSQTSSTTGISRTFIALYFYTGEDRYKDRRGDQQYIQFFLDDQSFHAYTSYGWGGFGSPENGVYVTLIEEFASKVGAWCKAIFDAANNV